MTVAAAALLFLLWLMGLAMFGIAARHLLDGRAAPARFRTDVDWLIPLTAGVVIDGFIAWCLIHV